MYYLGSFKPFPSFSQHPQKICQLFIEFSDFDTPILCTRPHLQPYTNTWYHRLLWSVKNKTPSTHWEWERERECYWGCCESAAKPIIKATPSGWKSKTHTQAYVDEAEAYQISNRFQFDFMCLRWRQEPWTTARARGTGTDRHVMGIMLSAHISQSDGREDDHKQRGVRHAQTLSRRGGVFVAAVNKAICLLCCLRLVL